VFFFRSGRGPFSSFFSFFSFSTFLLFYFSPFSPFSPFSFVSLLYFSSGVGGGQRRLSVPIRITTTHQCVYFNISSQYFSEYFYQYFSEYFYQYFSKYFYHYIYLLSLLVVLTLELTIWDMIVGEITITQSRPTQSSLLFFWKMQF